MSPEKKKATILVVEDEFITGEDIQNSLIDMGYDAPLVIDNAPDAIAKTGELRPDVVLMDVTLIGKMNGIEAASKIRSEYGIPVIFLTAHSDESTFEKAKDSEPFGYIIKPYEPRSLAISIEMARYKHALDEKLRQSEEKYRGFVQNFLGIAYRLNEDFTVVFFHGATEAITGYPEPAFSAGEISWEHLLYPDDAAGFLETNQKIRAAPGYSGTREYRIRRKDGEVRWIYELLQKVGRTNQSPAFIQGSCYDITERKNAEDAIRIANRKLNLLNNITRHDILNTLHGLLGLLEMAEDVITEKDARQILLDMRVSTTQIQKQITFTRNYQDVGVKAPVWQGARACVVRATAQIPLDPITIGMDLADSIEIFADPLLEKVFYNLVDNAVRYGEKIRRIRFSSSVRDNRLVLICEDDGIGVPPGEKERIFEQCVGKNTGMGLFLSREILMITGISIRECGEPGTGARFEIIIPSGSWRIRS
jgi:PAS domain S-box-containing protein